MIEPNNFIAVHSVIESKDEEFDDYRFTFISKPRDFVPCTPPGETRKDISHKEVGEP